MKHRESPKRHLLSMLHVLQKLIEEETSIEVAKAYQRDFAKKSAELVALEVAAYRKRFKLDKMNLICRSVPTRLSPKPIEI